MNIQTLLERSSSDHSRICPRQILGVRIGLAGMQTLGFSEPPANKQLLVISETDGCFVDGITSATGCAVGHRTLRVEDYGKVAATFVDTCTAYGVPKNGARVPCRAQVGLRREQACSFAPEESRHYCAQMLAYQSMPDAEMLTLQEVTLNTPIQKIVSRPGLRVNCDVCGEEIMNEREVLYNDLTLCPPCAHGGYYQSAQVSN